ncbi:MAG TPA: DnaJ domain-containing protein [Polyangiaceae bacterium]|nr:DnaJ domain-containing protein [Polyangiaceae bacterium]
MSAPTATGKIATTPFCELLVYALSQELNGSLVLECPDRSKHAILFVAGVPAKARVAHSGTRLGQVLLQLGSVEAEALRVALEEDSGELLGQRLYARGALDPGDLSRGLCEQLLRQLSWLSGAPTGTAFAYYDRTDLLEDWGGEPLHIDPLAAIWRAIDGHAPRDRMSSVLASLSGKTLRLHPDSRVARFDFNARIRGLLDVLKVKPQTTQGLEATKLLDSVSLHKLLYALVLTRHLDTGEAPLGVIPGSRVELSSRSSSASRSAVRAGQSQIGPAVRAGQSQIGPAVRVEAAGAARGVAAAPAPKVPPVAAAPAAAPKAPPVAAAPAAAPQPPPAPAKPPAAASAKAAPAKAAPAKTAPAVAARPAEPARAPAPVRPPAEALQTGKFLAREEIEAKLAGLDELTHYELLELPVAATPEQISQAFPSLARRWHPDRLSPELNELRDAVTRVFARMTEASRVLGNASSRKSYDESLGGKDEAQREQEQVELVLRAAEAFQKAEILLKKRDLESAEQLARTAHEGDPDQPEYAALYAWIRSRRADAGPEDIQSSLGMLKKAIAKQNNNVKIHYYLACVLKASGQTAAAMREFRYVAEHDPANVDAAREIRLHDMRKGQSKQPGADPGLIGKLFKR